MPFTRAVICNFILTIVLTIVKKIIDNCLYFEVCKELLCIKNQKNNQGLWAQPH